MAILQKLAGRLLVFGVVAVIAAFTGYYYARSSAAEERTEAVMAATAEAQARLQESLKDANVRARAHLERIEALRSDLRERQRAVERYAESEAGAEICLDPEGVEAFNAL